MWWSVKNTILSVEHCMGKIKIALDFYHFLKKQTNVHNFIRSGFERLFETWKF